MMRLVIVAVLVCTILASPITRELDDEWHSFKSEYAKAYSSDEDYLRRLTWENNIRFIQKHNLEADRGLHSFRVGMNAYGDLTDEEFTSTMNGYKMANKKNGSNFLPANNVDLPSEVDWRTKGYVTPVKDQKQCGSCWAFSAIASLEGQHFKADSQLVSLSEQNLMDCSHPEGNNACEGGLMDQAFEYIKKNKGVDTETSYSYKARDESCHFNQSNVGATDTGFMDIEKGNEDALQQAAATVGPISVAIDASRPSFRFYKTGVYNDHTCSSTRLDHGVTVVGYGMDGGHDYWLVKNSWGTSWGNMGYINMSRNRNNQCGIATAASYPLV
ncbi:hypothetical protein ScPMuIL_009755 [Solemya velum]